MADSFEDLGFLSPEVEDFRREQRRDKRPAFDQVEKVVATAMDDLRQFLGMADAAYLVGLGYWLRCVEACQGTVLLAERGLATTPHSSLRTAFECLFYAAAVWRHPQLADKMEASHHTERLKQANQMIKAGAETRVDRGRLADLKAVAAEVDPKAPGLSVYEAATQADLLFEYETIYRGLGLGGAHATLRSLDPYFDAKPDGSFDLKFEPQFDKLEWLLGLVSTCLTGGIARHRKAIAQLGS